jgi:TolB-like protein/Flp pilus assembly protein TadD
MSSLIPGYNYDIFISYRQKDNKHDGWVTEFVDNLKGELESTFKEEISVYFDISPHDGLLETYNVDASLKEKLKCLIFIPIISQTYCDSRSFAWQHEFRAFNTLAKEDKAGRDIRLSSGNVASRILPVKIHDLDPEDKSILENELGGVLRSVDFIYKSAGVNRPLRSKEEKPQDNLNKTLYRDQINKVANAVKEIITALKKQSQHPEEVSDQDSEVKHEHHKNLKARIITGTFISIVLIILGYFVIPRLFKPNEKYEKSIAVLPFRNDSPNDSNTYFINGIMEEVLNNLQKIKDLRVISRTSAEKYRNTTKSIPEIAKELGVNYIVEGSGQKYGSTFSLRVQLITAVKENHLWADSYEKEILNVGDICSIQRQIAKEIAKELEAVVTPQEEDLISQKPTNDTLAYDYYLKGTQYWSELKYKPAIDMFSKAIERDPEFAIAFLYRSSIYSRIYFVRGTEYSFSGDWEGLDKLAKADFEKAVKISPDLPELKLVQAEQLYRFERKHEKALELLDEAEDQLPNNPNVYYLRGAILRRMGKWEESLKEMSRKILLDPLNADAYIEIAHTYRLLRKYPEALEFYNKSQLLDLNDENTIGKYFTILLWKGDLKSVWETIGLDTAALDSFKYYYSKRFFKLLLNPNQYQDQEDQFGYTPKTLNLASICFFNENIPLSMQYADSAIAELKLKIIASPDDERYYAALGYAYGFKGENKKAIENGQKAVRLKPLKLDAWQGYLKELDLTKIYILTGEYDLAMDKIEYLLTIPGDLSVPLLKIDPTYDKLRDLPRFQKILTTEYETNYQ